MFRSARSDLHFIILKLCVFVSFIDSVCREENTLQDFRCRATVDISILPKGMLLVRCNFVVLFQTQTEELCGTRATIAYMYVQA